MIEPRRVFEFVMEGGKFENFVVVAILPFCFFSEPFVVSHVRLETPRRQALLL